MKLAIEEPRRVPLDTDSDGVIRVRGSRVTLDTIVQAFLDGATAEEIVQQYPTLVLADIYSVLSFYLQNEKSVTEYLKSRHQARTAASGENERRFDPKGVRDRLLGRRSKEAGGHPTT